MYNLKGFIRYNDLISNDNGVVSGLGEMSPLALTYTKEKGYYVQPTINGIELVSMSGKLTEGMVTSRMPAPDEVAELAILVGKWVMDVSEQSGLFTEINDQYPLYMDALNLEFTTGSNIHFDFTNAQMGEMLTMEIAEGVDKRMPSWLSWSMTYNDGVDDFAAVVKVWFADVAFRNEFDEYEIVVVPPIDDVDDFFGNKAAVQALIDQFTIPVMMEKIAEAIDIYPATLVKTFMFNWYDDLDPPNSISTPWTVVIYGMAGNNYDFIIAAIANYILTNSSEPEHDQPAWENVFPDIFKVTEFTITPMWNRMAIPNNDPYLGVYQPMVNFSQDMVEIAPTFATYPEEHVALHLMSGVLMYNSIAFYVVGSHNNRNDQEGNPIFDFDDIFPDYFAVSTGSNDFGRMSLFTQNWVIFILELLVAAKTMTESSTIPFNTTRIIRNNVMYLAGFYEGIQYLITSKQYFDEEVPPPEEI